MFVLNYHFQVLPYKWSRRALPIATGEVKLVDEDGVHYHCYVDHELPGGNGVALSRAWSRFIHMKQLKEGDDVLFGVTGPNADVIYYIPN